MTDNTKLHADLVDLVISAGHADLEHGVRKVLNLHAPSIIAPQFCAECNGLSKPTPWPCHTVRSILDRLMFYCGDCENFVSSQYDVCPYCGTSRVDSSATKIRAVFEDGPTDPNLWIVEGMTWPSDYQWVVFDEPTRHMHKCVWNHVGGGHYRLSEIEDLGPALPKAEPGT